MRFDAIPIWALFIGSIVVVISAIEVGYQLGRIRHRRAADEKESPISAIASTILGLAAFMLAFTFGLVSDRHTARKALVLDDAIAVRAAWQRSDCLPETDHAEAEALLRQYLDLRLSFAEVGKFERQAAKKLLADTDRLQNQLWSMAFANARKDMNSDVAALYIDSLNEMNAIHARRVSIGIQAQVAGEIWLVLYCITIIGTMSLGYQTGIAGSARSLGRLMLAVSFALAFALIASLERPDGGMIQASQQPLIDLRNSMGAAAGDAERG